MKRTPPWVWLAAVAVQVAALCVCTWAMEQWLPEREGDDETTIWPRRRARRAEGRRRPAPEPPRPAPPPPPPRSEQPSPERAATPSYADFRVAPPAAPSAPAPEPPRAEPPPQTHHRFGGLSADALDAVRSAWREPAGGPVPPPEPSDEWIAPSRPAHAQAAQAPAVPLFGPPPAREDDPNAVPPFIGEAADGTTQLMRAYSGARPVIFGFYPDGNIRFVDVDGGRYAGRAESARARMREVDGTRAFTVQIAVDGQQQLQAIFTGGVHDSETLALEPLVGWSVA